MSNTIPIIPNLFVPNSSCPRPTAQKGDAKTIVEALKTAIAATAMSSQKRITATSGSAFQAMKTTTACCGLFRRKPQFPPRKRKFDPEPAWLRKWYSPVRRVTDGFPIFHNSVSQLRYSMQEKLGNGSYSTVYKALEKHSNNPYAIKVLKAGECSQVFADYQKAGIREFQFLRDLQSVPHIVKMHNCFTQRSVNSRTEICLVLELLPESLVYPPSPSISDLSNLAKQLVLTMLALEKKDIFHGDLKPDNVSFSKKGLLTIFDLNCMPTEQERREGQKIGTLLYQAPEIALGRPYGFEVLSWTIGVTLYAAYVREILFTFKRTCESSEIKNYFASLLPYLGPVPKAWIDKVSPRIKELFAENYAGDYFPSTIDFFQRHEGNFSLIEPAITDRAAYKKDASPLVGHFIDFLRKTIRYEDRLTLSQMLEHPFIHRPD